MIKQKYVLNKAWILSCTFTSEEAYHSMQFNTAIAWLRYAVIADEDVVNKILAHPLFKPWWINQWNIRDEDWLCEWMQFVVADGHEEMLKEVWLRSHEVQNIKMQPPLKMLDEVLAEVTKQIEAEVKCKR